MNTNILCCPGCDKLVPAGNFCINCGHILNDDLHGEFPPRGKEGGPPCDKCGTIMIKTGGKFLCYNCTIDVAPDELSETKKPNCTICGTTMVVSGTTFKCTNCGNQTPVD